MNALRQTLDPVQAGLISAHVTLCREDEINGLSASAILQRVAAWAAGPLRLGFAAPQRADGHGVLLPCRAGAASFQQLRRWLLQDPQAREHGAHLTLAHPRNPAAIGNTDAALAACPSGLELHFETVALIEQSGSAPWQVLQETALGSAAPDPG